MNRKLCSCNPHAQFETLAFKQNCLSEVKNLPYKHDTNTHLYYCSSPSVAGGDGGISGDTASNSDLPRLDDECINNVIGSGEYKLTTISFLLSFLPIWLKCMQLGKELTWPSNNLTSDKLRECWCTYCVFMPMWPGHNQFINTNVPKPVTRILYH